MFRPRRAPKTDARRGIILLVVLALLTLFAIVGISFVLYANAEADASRIYREAQGFQDLRPDIPADQLLNWALSQVIYDVDDRPGATSAHLYSAMRGHSLARDMYGWDSDNTASNIYPFNGTGRFHGNITSTFNDEYNLINYEYFPADGFLRDPERYGNRTGANAANQPLNPYTGGWNSPYTYPDLNHCYLAAVDSNGNVLTPSFVRAWNGFGSMDPTNPNWNAPSVASTATADLKYMVLRPRPADMATGFPLPLKDPTTGAVGDVQNAVGITKGYDSFWMDLDYPVQTAPDGTKFKPLFAFLIMDLDNRLNLNMVGNVRGANNGHLSNRGYGPWEVNPHKLPNNGGTSDNEWPNLYLGYSPAAPAQPVAGRYGGPAQPNQNPPIPGGPAPGPYYAPGGPLPHVYGQVDYDACNGYSYPSNNGVAPAQYTLPGAPAGNTNPCFPTFPGGYENYSGNELLNHPLLYNVFAPTSPNRRFPVSDLNLLLNNGTSGTLWQSSNFGQLCPTLFGSAQLRSLVTTDSYDVNRPGLMPWFFDRTASGYAANTSDPYGPPSGPGVALPALTSRSGAVPQYSDFRLPGQSGNTGANAVDWRWNAVDTLGNALTKVDLNRFLPPYPHMGKWTQWPTPPSMTSPIGYDFTTPEVALGTCYQNEPSGNAVTQFNVAQQARQNMAADIYRVFLAVTGLPPVKDPTNPTAAEMAPRRWLAQLAVNIVDYIDEDDLSTPFNFGALEGITEKPTTVNGDTVPLTWVFGTELPRVVLNEVYAEFQNPTQGPPTYKPPATSTPATVNVRFWAELYNPLPSGATPPGAQPQDASGVPLYVTTNSGGYQPYQVVIAQTNTAANARGLWMPASGSNQQNVLGTPGATTAGAPSEIRAQTSTPATGGGTDFTQLYTIAQGTATIKTTPTSTTTLSLNPQDKLLLGPNTGPDQPDKDNFPDGPDVEGTLNVNSGNGTDSQKAGQLPNGTKAVLTPNMAYPVQASYSSTSNTYSWTFKGTAINDNNGGSLTVLLRRLAIPYMPYQPDPTKATPTSPYNPYVTVDFIDTVTLANDYTPKQTPPAMSAFPPWNAMMPTTTWSFSGPPHAYSSLGKQQPYAADHSQITNEQYPSTPPPGAPASQQTPTLHNLGVVPNTPLPPAATNPNNAYDWLVHLDRQLISPAELLQVSAYPPFLLTHQFITAPGGTTTKFTHRAPWFDEASLGVASGQSSRLYRALEFLDVHPRAAGVGFTGRVPGRVNINTIWDSNTFNALCDAQPPATMGQPPPNWFNTTDVSTMWSAIVGSRTPDPNPTAGGPNVPGPNSKPFLGMAAPNSPGGDPWRTNSTGIGDTLLRTPSGASTPLFVLPNTSGRTHPYQQDELLTKILNNVTTRSNVFAVWVTVGFFQVVQDTDAQGNPVRPVKLGAEIGASTNTNIRHRLFAIVDRSLMAIDQQVTTLAAQVTPTNPPGPVQVNLAATSGTTSNTNITWGITPGTVLLVGTGTSKEAVLVTAVNGNTITATFQQAHAANTPVTIPGNPGPQAGFNVNDPKYQDVVPYFAILQ